MKEYEKRAMIEEEDKYTFSQSSQISSQCGLIGYLRADMDTDGNGFYSNWNGFRDDFKTQEFKDEFDEVINDLREEGDILHNRGALRKYCETNPQAKMNTDRECYGVRVDTDKYAYLFRLIPEKGDYNVYCYCYRRDWLDDHIKQARRGIRFIDPDYKDLFRIKDGEKIRMTLSDGESYERVCRYIDDYHLEVGYLLYNICEFAERMKQNRCSFIPLRNNLPEQCYAVNKTDGQVIVLKKGETGFYKTDFITSGDEESREIVEEYNRKLGVTKAQAAAMYAGSMFGFDCPAADPAAYDAEGNLKKG